MDVVVVGELNADLILSGLAAVPRFGEIQCAQGMRLTLGSSSAIFACNIARLGVEVGFVGKVGNDLLGSMLVERLHVRGVDTSRIVRTDEAQTGICVVLSFPHDYAMASYPGVREKFCLDDVDLEYVQSARHMHMSSYFLQPALQPGAAELFRRAKRAGLTTSLDPDCDPAGKWNGGLLELLPSVDVFLPNEQEALRISGKNDLESALDSLGKLATTVVVKRGAAGILMSSQGQKLAIPGFHVDPLDTTGAGDSFNAGFISRFLKRDSLADCIAWGNACGAMSTLAMGGIEGFPVEMQVEEFFREHSPELEQMLAAFQPA
jgi:sugar/nucleoside kinase (ribokinase family)